MRIGILSSGDDRMIRKRCGGRRCIRPSSWSWRDAALDRLAVVLGRMRNKRARLQALDAADGGSRGERR